MHNHEPRMTAELASHLLRVTLNEYVMRGIWCRYKTQDEIRAKLDTQPIGRPIAVFSRWERRWGEYEAVLYLSVTILDRIPLQPERMPELIEFLDALVSVPERSAVLMNVNEQGILVPLDQPLRHVTMPAVPAAKNLP